MLHCEVFLNSKAFPVHDEYEIKFWPYLKLIYPNYGYITSVYKLILQYLIRYKITIKYKYRCTILETVGVKTLLVQARP